MPTLQGVTQGSSPWALHKALADSFLNIAKKQYNITSEVDPDIQVGLGTLYYMMADYDQARDCWVAALKERPDVGRMGPSFVHHSLTLA